MQAIIRLPEVKASTGLALASRLQEAINAKCRECIYDPKSGLGTWRNQVGACTSRMCPLYLVRPLPRKRGQDEISRKGKRPVSSRARDKNEATTF